MQATKRTKKLTYALIIAATIAVMGLVGVSVAGAKGGGGACHGTYYVDIDDAAGEQESYALWTFNQDGTFQGTDTAEAVVPFSHAQGAWQHTRAREAKGTWFDFSYFNEPANPTVARVDAELEFGDGCQTFDGTYVIGFYFDLNGYPFDPADAAFSSGGLFTGQRVNP